VGNFETIDVFFSWDGSAARVDRKCENFDRLWSGDTRDLTIMELPDAVRSELIRIARPPTSHVAGDDKAPYGSQGSAAGPVLRDYQDAAVGAWLSAGARGILSMATGAGKTKTALAAIRRFAAETPVPPVVVIVAPFIHLVDQWDEECRASGMRPILCYESSKDWQPRAWEALDAFRVLPDRPPCYIATMHTATLGPFAALLRAVADRPTLLVADEVHHLGSDTGSTILDQRIDWRLGLSATPQRWNDELGTALIESFFGGVVYEYTIAQAIAGGYLVPYRYEPVLVDLDRDELGEYRDLMAIIEQVAADPEARSSDRLRRLLEQRALLLNSAAGKYAALRRDIENRRLSRTLVYCASRLQLGAASDVIRDIGHIPVPFTAEEGRVERGRILRDFETGRSPAIVAMKALDEGVDIPDTREAHLLASSGNPREFIQRRGRILRLAPGKQEARLVDYVVIPAGRGVFEREIATREMERVLDFAASSIEPDRARSVVWPALDAFDLLHLVGRG
jgi:superfamily II DNA or RNA helicase